MSAQRYVSPYSIALVYVGLGDRDHAFQWLDKAYDEHSVRLINIAGNHDSLDCEAIQDYSSGEANQAADAASRGKFQ